MPVTKHDIEWLIHTLDAYGDILPDELVEQARLLIEESCYRRSVCVIHPVDEGRYRQVALQLQSRLTN